GRATATVWPASTLGAPQTIVAGPSALASPRSTSHTRRRSARGWGLVSSTRPTTKRSSACTPWWSTASTLGPVIVRRCSMPGTSIAGSQYSRSQSSGTLISSAPSGRDRARSSELLQKAQIVLEVEAQVRDAVLEHRDPLDSQAPREPLHSLGVVPGGVA